MLLECKSHQRMLTGNERYSDEYAANIRLEWRYHLLGGIHGIELDYDESTLSCHMNIAESFTLNASCNDKYLANKSYIYSFVQIT